MADFNKTEREQVYDSVENLVYSTQDALTKILYRAEDFAFSGNLSQLRDIHTMLEKLALADKTVNALLSASNKKDA